MIESLSALEMILFILYMVLFISQQTSEKQEILNLNQQLQQANEQLRIYAEESAHTAQVQERNRLAREIHDTLGHVLTGITAGADACIQMMDDSPEMARHQMELIADTARNGMNRCPALGQGTAAGLAGKRKPLGCAQQDVYQHGAEQRHADPAGRVAGRADALTG